MKENVFTLLAVATCLLGIAAATAACARRDRGVPQKGPMLLTVESVDYAPDELYGQTPFEAELLRQLPGDDRPDYWLGRLRKPLRWIKDGSERRVEHVVVAARWQGTTIALGAHLPVGIAYVTDEQQVTAARFDVKKAAYVAIGMASVTPL